jgi:hypothetical protein
MSSTFTTNAHASQVDIMSTCPVGVLLSATERSLEGDMEGQRLQEVQHCSVAPQPKLCTTVHRMGTQHAGAPPFALSMENRLLGSPGNSPATRARHPTS